jgi:hypothetical protein
MTFPTLDPGIDLPVTIKKFHPVDKNSHQFLTEGIKFS